jgi:uncharacterized protein
MTVVHRLVSRVDSWMNALTGLGTLRDKLASTQMQPAVRLSEGTLEAMYNDDDIAAKIVDKVPRAATRRGFSLELEGESRDTSAEVARLVVSAAEDMSLLPKLCEAWIWGRLYGGGAVYVGADDGQDPALPLNEQAIRSIRFLNVLTKAQLRVKTRYAEVSAPKYGEPETYEVTNTTARAGGGVVIHETRLIMFGGALTARTWSQTPDGWDDSVLQRVRDTLTQTATAWQSTAHLLSDASQGVFKVSGLIDLIATGGESALRTRFEMMDQCRSVCRSILVDAERESFERVATSFTGIPDVLDRMMSRCASAAEMPVTELWGRSPAGLNATGESDTRSWYDTVEAGRTDVLKPRLERAVRLTMLAKDGPTRGIEPPNWKLSFPPLWQPTDEQKANTRKTKAETVATLVREEILLREEAALELAKDGDFTVIDVESRQRILQAEVELREETAGEPPPRMLPPGGPVQAEPELE